MKNRVMMIILIMVGALLTGCSKEEISNEDFNKVVVEIMEHPEYLEKYEKEIEIESRSNYAMAEAIHEMANTLIVAEDGKIRGKHKITQEYCNYLILECMICQYKNKDEFISILVRFRKGDYSNAVRDHNYVWGLLDGEVGLAVRLNSKTKRLMASK